jgi:cation diffusion facilitator family transporter
MRSELLFYATIALDIGLFAVNLLVAGSTGSRAVLSQAAYSLSDLLGSAFLLVGLYSSRRPPDARHPFGFGKERFFWAFVATLIAFTLAGFFSLAIGVLQIVEPVRVIDLSHALLVVAATLVASVVGLAVAFRELRRSRQSFGALWASSQVGVKNIVYQDFVGLLGAAVALGGLGLVYATHQTAFDGVAAAIVGGLMIVTGVLLSAESRDLLTGRAIPPEVARSILMVAQRHPKVRSVREIQSMLLGPDDTLVALRVNFQDGLTTDQVEQAIDELSVDLKSSHSTLRHLIIEPES